MSAKQLLPQRLMINDETAAQVEEQAATPHFGELVGAEQAGVAGSPVHMQRDSLGYLQQFVESFAAPSIAERELVGDVVEVDPHANRLGDDRQLGADVAVTDDAQRSASYLMRTLGRLIPDPGVHLRVLVGQMPCQRDDLGDYEFHDAAGVGEGCIENRDTPAGGSSEVYLVGTNAKGTDRLQVGSGVENGLGHICLGANAQQLHSV